jgi:prepilin-type N-terminal cleavage/methylation domain-containing protein
VIVVAFAKWYVGSPDSPTSSSGGPPGSKLMHQQPRSARCGSALSSHRSDARRGFTLIELLIALVIISIIAGLAIPRIDFTGLRSDAGARLLRTTLTNASRMAVLRQHDVIVSFDGTKQGMLVIEDANNNGVLDSGERTSWKPLEDGVGFYVPKKGIGGGTPTSTVVGSNIKSIGGLPSVVFHRSGSSSTGLEAYLSTPRGVDTDARAVMVTQSTGRVDWFRLTANGWRAGGV